MTKNKNVLTNGHKKEIQDRLQYGDFTTLGAVLGCNPEAARKRFDRNNPKAIAAMEKIVNSREQLKEEFKED